VPFADHGLRREATENWEASNEVFVAVLSVSTRI
jgi:hypothetical protein